MGGAESRGGAESVPFFEWGGKNADGTDGFAEHRPGWPMPIHQLLVKRGVSAVFHGHDHLYVHGQRDGIHYQEVPQPGNLAGGTRSAEEYGYASGTILGSPGHVRVRVTPAATTVEFVRTALAAGAEGQGGGRRGGGGGGGAKEANGAVIDRYEIPARTVAVSPGAVRSEEPQDAPRPPRNGGKGGRVGKGPPQDVIDAAKGHTFDAHLANTPDEVADCLASGFAGAFSRSWAGEGSRDKNGMVRPSPSAHCETLAGVFVAANGETGFLHWQSWGENTPSGNNKLQLGDGSEYLLSSGEYGVYESDMVKAFRSGDAESWHFECREGSQWR
jgi:hypothetical protein